MSAIQLSQQPARRSVVVLGSIVAGPGVVQLASEPLMALLRAVHGGPSQLTALPPDDLVAGACAAALVTAYGLWSLGLALALAEASSSRLGRLVRRLPCPTIARTVAASALGVAVVVSAAPAGADPGLEARRPSGLTSSADALAGLPLPDRVPTRRAARSAPTEQMHEVVAGDTLWDIAADALPPGASAATVERAWHRIAAANRGVVTDPHLIFPGTQLRVPQFDDLLGEDQP